MTIGEKIKYCRIRCRITQAKLAELSGISLVSIKRYESDKMIPTSPQIKKLANVLGIGALAFSDTYFDSLQELETYGDLIRLLIIFRKNHLIQIDGERDENGHILSPTATFKLNPIIGKFFGLAQDRDTLTKDISFCLIDNRVLENLLKWESVYTKYENLVSKYKDRNDEDIIAVLKENDEVLCKIELELQYDNLMLKRTDGHITVKINPDYKNVSDFVREQEKAIDKELKLLKSQVESKKRKKKEDEQ